MLYGSVQVAKGAAKIPVGGLIQQYRDRYAKENVEGHIRYEIYLVDRERRMVHFKLPSSSLLKAGVQFFYDVVLEFIGLNVGDIEHSDVHLFSNSPGFTYRSAYSLHFYGSRSGGEKLSGATRHRSATNSQLIPELNVKYPPVVFNEPPSKVNPGELAISDSTIYYALFYLLDHISPQEILDRARPVNLARVIQSVASVDRVAMERKKVDAKAKKAKKARAKDIASDFEKTETGLAKTNGVRPPKKPLPAKSMARVGGSTRKPRSPRTTGRSS